MTTLNFTKSELSVLAGIIKNSRSSQSIVNKAQKALGYSVPVSQDNSAENFAKRIISYIGLNNPDIRETEMTDKWVKMLAKRVKIFLKGNELKPSEELAICLAEHNTKEFKKLHPNYRNINQLYKGVQAFVTKQFPSEDTFKGKLINIVFTILGVIDGRFGNRVLIPKIRYWWRWVTYGTLVILFFVYIFIPFMDWWQGVVDYINYVRWYS